MFAGAYIARNGPGLAGQVADELPAAPRGKGGIV